MKKINLNSETLMLFGSLPSKFCDRVYKIERDYDLIDDCKYILYLNDNYHFLGMQSFPVKSIKEAVSFIMDSSHV